MPYSTGCLTPLSNFEANQNYKDVDDPAGNDWFLFSFFIIPFSSFSQFFVFVVVVSFPLVDEPDVSFLAWTTTPWTLPSNLALCVNESFDYIKILGWYPFSFTNLLQTVCQSSSFFIIIFLKRTDKNLNKKFILLEKRLVALYKDPAKSFGTDYEILSTIPGSQLKGKRYEPLFPYLEVFLSHITIFIIFKKKKWNEK